MADAPAQSKLYFYFRIREPGAADRILIVDTQELTIGRSQESDLNAKYADVSRRHAVIQREANKFSVHNLSNSSSTFVNGRAVQSHVLKSQDAIRIGELEIAFVESTDNPAKLGPRLEYASQLKSFAPAANHGGNPEATILGVAAASNGADDGFAVGRAGDFGYGLDARDDAARAPRDLDLELDGFGLHDDREPVELTPEALAPAASAAPQPVAKGATPPPRKAPRTESADAWTLEEPRAERALCVNLEIEGLTPELRTLIGSLLGKVVSLPTLKIRVKGADLD
ncbi:MAG TPA: FHA domain-containing protein [Myxococcota bacterium]|nr:FHA domain-containing protein [Myxococcota bacterium]